MHTILDLCIEHMDAYTCARVACTSTNMKKKVEQNIDYFQASIEEFPRHYLIWKASCDLHMYIFSKEYHKESVYRSYLPAGKLLCEYKNDSKQHETCPTSFF